MSYLKTGEQLNWQSTGLQNRGLGVRLPSHLPVWDKEKMGKISQKISSLKTFVSEVKVELVKCAWPTRKELFGQSVVVIIAVIILGIFVGLCDAVNMNLLSLIIRQGMVIL